MLSDKKTNDNSILKLILKDKLCTELRFDNMEQMLDQMSLEAPFKVGGTDLQGYLKLSSQEIEDKKQHNQGIYRPDMVKYPYHTNKLHLTADFHQAGAYAKAFEILLRIFQNHYAYLYGVKIMPPNKKDSKSFQKGKLGCIYFRRLEDINDARKEANIAPLTELQYNEIQLTICNAIHKLCEDYQLPIGEAPNKEANFRGLLNNISSPYIFPVNEERIIDSDGCESYVKAEDRKANSEDYIYLDEDKKDLRLIEEIDNKMANLVANLNCPIGGMVKKQNRSIFFQATDLYNKAMSNEAGRHTIINTINGLKVAANNVETKKLALFEQVLDLYIHLNSKIKTAINILSHPKQTVAQREFLKHLKNIKNSECDLDKKIRLLKQAIDIRLAALITSSFKKETEGLSLMSLLDYNEANNYAKELVAPFFSQVEFNYENNNSNSNSTTKFQKS